MSATAAIVATMTAAHKAMYVRRALLNLKCACTLHHTAMHAERA
jgi:hypothetical protein